MAVRSETPYPVTWQRGRVVSWLVTVDHKRIGIMYIATALVFFGAGGILAVLMRAQLATPKEHFLTKDSYNQVLTMHGTTTRNTIVVPCIVMTSLYEFFVRKCSPGPASCARMRIASKPASAKKKIDVTMYKIPIRLWSTVTSQLATRPRYHGTG